jgi:hypothetical protein
VNNTKHNTLFKEKKKERHALYIEYESRSEQKGGFWGGRRSPQKVASKSKKIFKFFGLKQKCLGDVFDLKEKSENSLE